MDPSRVRCCDMLAYKEYRDMKLPFAKPALVTEVKLHVTLHRRSSYGEHEYESFPSWRVLLEGQSSIITWTDLMSGESDTTQLDHDPKLDMEVMDLLTTATDLQVANMMISYEADSEDCSLSMMGCIRDFLRLPALKDTKFTVIAPPADAMEGGVTRDLAEILQDAVSNIENDEFWSRFHC